MGFGSLFIIVCINDVMTNRNNSYRLFWLLVICVILAVTCLIMFPPNIQQLGMGASETKVQKTEETQEIIQGKKTKVVITTKFEQSKTLWDWLPVIIAPLTLALLGLWFQFEQEKASATKLREDSLESYINAISALFSERKLREIKKEDSADQKSIYPDINIIRIRTLSILRRLINENIIDNIRIIDVINFLQSIKIFDFDENFFELVNLSNANLQNVDFNGFKLKNINLEHCDLRGSRLLGADLTNAKLYKTNLEKTILTKAILNEAVLGEANLQKSLLIEAQLKEANLKKANLKQSNMKKANLEGANLEGANLKGADLRETSLKDTYLKESNMNKANLEGANLEGADLEGVSLKRAKGLKSDQVKQAIHWDLAIYDLEFRNQLGLPIKFHKI